ncbi:MAG: hypothetical protein V4474_03395 [Patescibacteria group bacterium]
MQPKTLVTIGAFVGSTVGGYLPALWGGSVFTFSSLLLGAVGAFVGIWLGWQISQRYF